jgi:hypothetical protein
MFTIHANNRQTLNIELVDTNVMVHHCLMVPNDDNESSYHEIWSQELWGGQFKMTVREKNIFFLHVIFSIYIIIDHNYLLPTMSISPVHRVYVLEFFLGSISSIEA